VALSQKWKKNGTEKVSMSIKLLVQRSSHVSWLALTTAFITMCKKQILTVPVEVTLLTVEEIAGGWQA